MVWLYFMVLEESRSIHVSRPPKIVKKHCPQMRHWLKWGYWMHSIWIWLFWNFRIWITFYSLKGKRETVQGYFHSFTGYSSLLIRLDQHAYCLVHLVTDVQVSRLKDAMSKIYPQLEVLFNINLHGYLFHLITSI